MKQYQSGVKGEEQAERYLQERGMVCVARRYRAERGEIDLVMQEGDTVVMVEVKYRPHGAAGDGLMAVTEDKRRRMTRAATAFLVEREWLCRPVRFDVVEITSAGVLHVRNAFLPGDYYG